ncbi:PREDICTED: transient-receptor-potential-like protein [Branchiostoma belcheri]|uniref:Transient-receptor-potential-like protein n=1 Tax=Branchiostoma belcheri TaxID=7741 RepID=A0A6P5AVU8_BRABE|nr:PREDICTED: transient-receptor-potential-like protein [Branchiostoma belcheri]
MAEGGVPELPSQEGGLKSYSPRRDFLFTSEPRAYTPLDGTGRLRSKERVFLEAVERGDKATVGRCLQPPHPVNVNVTSGLGRSALTTAVTMENAEIVELLLKQDGIRIGSALLHAIREGVYRIVEMMVNHSSMTPAMLGAGWSCVSPDCEDFSPCVSPVILAAQLNQFQILQLLLSQGATISDPHMPGCHCRGCTDSNKNDSLRYSIVRMETYRALASPSWISLTSSDPILTAFKLSWDLRHLATNEREFKESYLNLAEQCRKYPVELLDQCRSSVELNTILNQENAEDDGIDEDHQGPSLYRLKLALKYEQKQFVAHPHCQQLLTAMWHDGLPGWRRRSVLAKLLVVMTLMTLMPIVAVCYVISPRSRMGRFMRYPFIKFVSQAGSFAVFLILLTMASPREENMTNRRGPPPSTVEVLIVFYVAGLVWSECKQLWNLGLYLFIRDYWNWLDFIMNSLYLATISLRVVAYVRVTTGMDVPMATERKNWPSDDPTLISEGLFAVANVFSFFRVIYLFQTNPHLGPLQITLGCMLLDIGKFLSVFFLIMASFAVGFSQLYGFYRDTEVCEGEGGRRTCQGNPTEFLTFDAAFLTLFWSLFKLIGQEALDMQEKNAFLVSTGSLLLGAYQIAAVVILLNQLIATMTDSYQDIDAHADMEWKYARTKLWLSYFDDGTTLPPPYNIIVTPKSIYYFLKEDGPREKERGEDTWGKYQSVLKRLVRRYIHHYKSQQTEKVADDIIAEIKQDFSSLRFEMREYRRKDASREAVQTQFLRDITAEIRKAAAVSRQAGPVTEETASARPLEPPGGARALHGTDRVGRMRRKLAPKLRDDLYRMLRQTLSEQVGEEVSRDVTSHPLYPASSAGPPPRQL